MLVHVSRGSQAVAAAQGFRRPLLAYLWHGDVRTLLIAPAIYSLIVPLLMLDLWVTAYQWICFTALGIARVERNRYFVVDRHRLAYLNALEKVNCTFCSYANGLFGYVREVSARTEQYWCPIQHGQRVTHPHGRYRGFVPYGDGEAYRTTLPALRRALASQRHRSVRATRGGVSRRDGRSIR